MNYDFTTSQLEIMSKVAVFGRACERYGYIETLDDDDPIKVNAGKERDEAWNKVEFVVARLKR